MCFSFTACSGDDDVIYVYTEPGFAPFEYMVGTDIVGVDMEIANVIGYKLGKRVEVKNVSFDTITEAIKKSPSNSIGIAGMTIKQIDGITFSTPYFTSQQYILAKKGTIANTNGEAAISVLSGKKIGVQLGTTGHSLVQGQKDDGVLNNSTDIQGNAKFDFLAQQLNADALDAMVLDEVPAQQFLSKYSNWEMIKITGVEIESYGVAIASGETELIKAINDAMASIAPEQIQLWVDLHNIAAADAE